MLGKKLIGNLAELQAFLTWCQSNGVSQVVLDGIGAFTMPFAQKKQLKQDVPDPPLGTPWIPSLVPTAQPGGTVVAGHGKEYERKPPAVPVYDPDFYSGGKV